MKLSSILILILPFFYGCSTKVFNANREISCNCSYGSTIVNIGHGKMFYHFNEDSRSFLVGDKTALALEDKKTSFVIYFDHDHAAVGKNVIDTTMIHPVKILYKGAPLKDVCIHTVEFIITKDRARPDTNERKPYSGRLFGTISYREKGVMKEDEIMMHFSNLSAEDLKL